MKTMLSTFKVNLFLEARNFTATTILPSLLQGFGALGMYQPQGPFVETWGRRRAIHASRASSPPLTTYVAGTFSSSWTHCWMYTRIHQHTLHQIPHKGFPNNRCVLAAEISDGRKWQPTPVSLPGESQGRGSLVGCRLWGRTESDTTEAT